MLKGSIGISVVPPLFAALFSFGTWAYAQGAAVIQSQDTNSAGVLGELIQARRSDGVLSVRVRLKNTGAKPARVDIYKNRNSSAYYVQAAKKKYFVLQDSEKVPLMPQWDGMGGLSVTIAAGASYTWWAKYPAPADSIKKFNFYWPLGTPFEDVPIADK